MNVSLDTAAEMDHDSGKSITPRTAGHCGMWSNQRSKYRNSKLRWRKSAFQSHKAQYRTMGRPSIYGLSWPVRR